MMVGQSIYPLINPSKNLVREARPRAVGKMNADCWMLHNPRVKAFHENLESPGRSCGFLLVFRIVDEKIRQAARSFVPINDSLDIWPYLLTCKDHHCLGPTAMLEEIHRITSSKLMPVEICSLSPSLTSGRESILKEEVCRTNLFD
jgi:hypothetical protein